MTEATFIAVPAAQSIELWLSVPLERAPRRPSQLEEAPFGLDRRRLRLGTSASRLGEDIALRFPKAHKACRRERLDTFDDRSSYPVNWIDLQQPVHQRKRERGAIHVHTRHETVSACAPHPSFTIGAHRCRLEINPSPLRECARLGVRRS